MECVNLPELTKEAWSLSLLQQLNGRRYPLGGTFELTERCNLSCFHCYINQPAGSKVAAAREMSLAEIRDLLDQLAAAGCLWLLLTGGEPLIRPDFLEIYDYAKRKGFLLTLFTNGTLLTPQTVDHLAEFPPNSLEITLYGRTQQTYERVTRVPGSHARCMRGIDLALDRGLPLGLKAFLLQGNRHELQAMQRYAEELGVDFRFDGMLFPRLDDAGWDRRGQIPAEDVVDLDMDDPGRCAEWRQFWDKFGGTPSRADYVFQCGAGHHSFHIDSSGQLSMCLMARQPAYDLLAGNFQDAWDRHLGALRAAKRTQRVKCETCAFLSLCRQCPGWSQLVHGDDETPVEFLCRIGHLRAARLGLLDR
jgi:radical SAM protein with 4Fe4S-binding SPASM domain